MKKILMTILIASCLVAHTQTPHEFLFGGGLGMSTLKYDGSKAGFGGNLNIDYAYNFNKNWALFTGLELDFLSAKAKNSNFNTTELIHVAAYAPFGDDRFDYNADISGFSEKQNAMYLSIPIMARYHRAVIASGAKHSGSFYAMGGLKLGIPMSSKFDQSIDQYTTTGYSYLTAQMHENEPENGFSTYANQSQKTDLDLKFNIALALEAGYEWNLSQYRRIYTGIYFDYGLNNIASADNSPVISYNSLNPSKPLLNSITASSSKVKATAVGVMVRYSLNPDPQKAAMRQAQRAQNKANKEQEREAKANQKAEAAAAAQLAEQQRLAAAEKARQDSINEAARLAEAQRQAELARAKAVQDSIDKANTVTVKGVVKDQKNDQAIAASIEITNNSTGETVQTVQTNPQTGEYTFDLKKGSDYGVAVKKDGYLFGSQNIDLTKESPENAAETQKSIRLNMQLEKVEKGAKMALENTFYEPNKTNLSKESETELENIVKLLNENPDIRLEVSGHTDNKGSAASNKKVSEARAKSVVDHLVKKGIDPKRLTVVGYGFDQPIADNNTEEGRAKNRRTEIKVIE